MALVNIAANYYKPHTLFGYIYSLCDHGDMTEVYIVHPDTLMRNSWFVTTLNGNLYRTQMFSALPNDAQRIQMNIEKARNFFISIDNILTKERAQWAIQWH